MSPAELQAIKQRYGIIGNAQQLNYAIQVAAQVAPTEMTVLITGESGVGKESFSKIIHAQSKRRHGQFIAINCGAIPEGTIDSELFGHEKGSFTGATDARKGYFEVTDGGTLFLDEIGEMPLGTQARLLRVLETGDFIRVGSSKTQKTDVRVVAATNVNLLEAVSRGAFREDLYYRLNTVPIHVPPLRERGQDIELLFRKFAADFGERYHVRPIKLLPDALELLLAYDWPGNIRQLKNIADQVSALETDRDVPAARFAKYLPAPRSAPRPSMLPAIVPGREPRDEALSERDLLYRILFDLKRDVTELKQVVLELATDEGTGGRASLLRGRERLFADAAPAAPNGAPASPPPNDGARLLPPPAVMPESEPEMAAGPSPMPIDELPLEPDTQDIEHSVEVESLSLDKNERELIIKALTRNGGRRKQAAGELGISERTLYRKLKQYAIEEGQQV